MSQAIERDAEGQRALFAGDDEAARSAFAAAAELYRESWLQAPPDSYGRLVGMLKAAVLAGQPERFAEFGSRIRVTGFHPACDGRAASGSRNSSATVRTKTPLIDNPS
jgi:hypothetical protein